MYEEQLVKVQAIVSGVRQRAKELPGFVYHIQEDDDEGSICLYRSTPENPNGCLIGYGARTAGIDLDGYEPDTNAADAIGMELHLRHDFSYSESGPQISMALEWLERVQAKQDDHRSWSEAVAYADRQPAMPKQYT